MSARILDSNSLARSLFEAYWGDQGCYEESHSKHKWDKVAKMAISILGDNNEKES